MEEITCLCRNTSFQRIAEEDDLVQRSLHGSYTVRNPSRERIASEHSHGDARVPKILRDLTLEQVIVHKDGVETRSVEEEEEEEDALLGCLIVMGEE